MKPLHLSVDLLAADVGDANVALRDVGARFFVPPYLHIGKGERVQVSPPVPFRA